MLVGPNGLKLAKNSIETFVTATVWNFFIKGGFFSKSSIHFLDIQISKKNIPKNYPELEIQISRQLQYTVVVRKFKF